VDSSLDVRIAKKQIGPDVEAAIGDTSCGRCDPWFPAKMAALGDHAWSFRAMIACRMCSTSVIFDR
jgi:hypothetical protein